MTIAISGTTGITLDGQFNSASSMGFKNRIINGAMVIDQRNAGASVAITTSDNYITDRFFGIVSANSKLTGQQNAGSVTPPAGFANYLGMTVAAAANVTVGASETYLVGQQVEGFNMSDLAWGTASASAVTLSFWVRSSVTGTFGGSLRNSAANRSYPFTYAISASNTWEQKSVTIAGDTSGTWLTTNGIGIRLLFSLGSGTTLSGTAGAWAGANYTSATGAVKLIETNSATFYITGVQLEKGSTATSFDYRSIGTELALCQRYYEILGVNNAAARSFFVDIYAVTTSIPSLAMLWSFAVPKRAAPTVATIGTFTTSNLAGAIGVDGTPSFDSATLSANPATTGRAFFFNNANSGFSASSEL